MRDATDVNYVVDNVTNRYTSVDGNSLSYDAAGNLTKDKDSYEYQYDYENRIVKITKSGQTKAEFAYDALGRRIEKKDLIDPNNTRRYYYNNNWQVLCETDSSDVIQRSFIYGNTQYGLRHYIDEVLLMKVGSSIYDIHYYLHDHLHSPVAMTNVTGYYVNERYEYDAYGDCNILDADFSRDADQKSDFGNPYYFQGKRLDLLDNGNLELMSWPYRNYSTYLGRWYQAEKLGIIPNDNKEINPFYVRKQYEDGANMYEYISSNPIIGRDTFGLATCEPGSKMCITRIWRSYEIEQFPSKVASVVKKVLEKIVSIGSRFCRVSIQAVAIPANAFPSTSNMTFLGARLCRDEQYAILDCVCSKKGIWECENSTPKKRKCYKWHTRLVQDCPFFTKDERLWQELLKVAGVRRVKKDDEYKKIVKPTSCGDTN